MIFALAHHAHDTAVYYQHGACAAWSHPAVEGAAFEGDATASRLCDGVLLGVHGSHAVLGDTAVGMNHLTEKMPHLVAVRESARRAHVACHEDLTILDDDASAAATVAGGALSHGVGHIHKVFVPRRTFILLIFNILQHLLHAFVKVFDGAVVLEHIVGLVDALAEVLLVRVGVGHLALFVGHESLVTH